MLLRTYRSSNSVILARVRADLASLCAYVHVRWSCIHRWHGWLPSHPSLRVSIAQRMSHWAKNEDRRADKVGTITDYNFHRQPQLWLFSLVVTVYLLPQDCYLFLSSIVRRYILSGLSHRLGSSFLFSGLILSFFFLILRFWRETGIVKNRYGWIDSCSGEGPSLGST